MAATFADLRKQVAGSGVRSNERRSRRQKAPHGLGVGEISDLVQAYRDGRTVNELARQFGVHRQTAAGVLDAAGVPRRRRPLSPAQVSRAVILRQSGWTFAAMGTELGCDPSTVWRALAALDQESRRSKRRGVADRT